MIFSQGITGNLITHLNSFMRRGQFMNTNPASITRAQQPPQVFSHNQKKFGYTVVMTQSSTRNDWNNPHTMKDLYSKGFYQ